MPLLDAMRLAPKRSPIKCAPVTVLQINKNCQNAEHHQAGQNSLLIHEGGKLRAAAPQREVGNGNSKVNERAIRVKPVTAKPKSKKRSGLKTPEGALRDETYLPCVEATVVPLALLEVLFAAAPGFVLPLFFCATLFCGADAFPCAIFFLLKSFTILATYARVS